LEDTVPVSVLLFILRQLPLLLILVGSPSHPFTP